MTALWLSRDQSSGTPHATDGTLARTIRGKSNAIEAQRLETAPLRDVQLT